MVIKQPHVGDDVSRVKLTFSFGFFALFYFGDAFSGNQNLVDEIAHFFGGDTFLHVIPDLGLLTGEDVDNIPLIAGRWNGHGAIKLIEGRREICKNGRDESYNDWLAKPLSR
jgi:hypothetical protein